MSFEWVFINAKRVRAKNKLSPPKPVRKIVTGEHLIDGPCIWWYYDPSTGYAVVSNSSQLNKPSFGRASLENDNVVVPDAGLVDVVFESLSPGDCLVFLGTNSLLSGEKKELYMLHEDQVYELLDDPVSS